MNHHCCVILNNPDEVWDGDIGFFQVNHCACAEKTIRQSSCRTTEWLSTVRIRDGGIVLHEALNWLLRGQSLIVCLPVHCKLNKRTMEAFRCRVRCTRQMCLASESQWVEFEPLWLDYQTPVEAARNRGEGVILAGRPYHQTLVERCFALSCLEKAVSEYHDKGCWVGPQVQSVSVTRGFVLDVREVHQPDEQPIFKAS